MPRLSHTLDLSPLDREDLRRSVEGIHRVLRSCRFDEDGYLLALAEEEVERLDRRAVELGVVDAELHRERSERAEAEERERKAEWERTLADLQRDTDELNRTIAELNEELGLPPEKEEKAADEPEPEEEAEPRTQLRLLSGAHLAPGSHYLLNELDLDEHPLIAEEYDGWLGTDITVGSWSEAGVCALDFAMRDVPDQRADGGAEGGPPPPSTSGRLEHDRGAEVLTLTATLRFPASSAFVRWGSRLLTVGVTARVDLPGWYASLNGADVPAPVRLEVEHPLARALAEVRPELGAQRRWSVDGTLDVRGKGLSRPIVAVAAWALRRSLHRSEDWSFQEQVAQVESAWEEAARGLHALPALLDEVAESLERAGGTGVSRGRHPNR
ncbi:hypothetical protein [Nocardiopsis ganjiahuensis]|uniref:hypothetical protein n=1 Tax=Nocardiopsis ganjiahuensis TaxID=239984 RepID=UPI000346E0E6|nr:hypothetical protein [Nocardiopsis ganjiahuensis]